MEFEGTENLLDVLTQYEILGFCRLGLNRLKFYRTKTWDIMTENQIPAGCRLLKISKLCPNYRYHNWWLLSQVNLNFDYCKIILVQRHLNSAALYSS
jgi:hypothetical protein